MLESAGQAVVQFVAGVHDRHHYAVKFYLDREAFLTEAALYAAAFASVRSTVSADVAERGKITCGNAESEGGLRTDGEPMGDHEAMSKFLPQVEAVCDSGASHLTDPGGHSLPPCIVIERGESLHDWSDRAHPDLFTALAVRGPMTAWPDPNIAQSSCCVASNVTKASHSEDVIVNT